MDNIGNTEKNIGMTFIRAGLGLIRIKLSERASELSNKNKKVKFVAGHTDGTGKVGA